MTENWRSRDNASSDESTSPEMPAARYWRRHQLEITSLSIALALGFAGIAISSVVHTGQTTTKYTDELEARISKLASEIDTLKANNDRASSELKNAVGQLAPLQARAADLKKSNQDLQSLNADLDKTNQQLTAAVDLLCKMLEKKGEFPLACLSQK